MRIKYWYATYWIVLHLAIGIYLGYNQWENRLVLLAIEAGLCISLAIALYLSSLLQKPVQIMEEGLNLIKDSDLGTHFVPSNYEEIALLIKTYNRMIDSLRQERLALKEKQFFLEKIVQASQTGLIMLDYDGRITLLNPSAEALLGKSELWAGKTLDLLPYPFGPALDTLPPGAAQLLMLASRKRVKCSKGEFFDQGFARQFIMLDELTEELRVSEKAASEKLIRVISHEINNSLASVSSLLQTCLLYAEQISPDDREDYEMAMKVMISRANHLNSFMRSYANVIRLSKPQKQLLNMQTVLRDIALLFKADFASRNIALKWEVHPQTQPQIGIDRAQMEQVLVNIIKNAMEAIDKNGEVVIRMEPLTKQTLLVIEDTGPGIPAEVKESLFTPFFSTKENGQGIGLTMIQEILVLHGFEFALDSAPGKRTQFKIWLE
jgi:nitrogen fixation/metabolism regulation signal transduction histidine kinase